jgi:hypothetical protein
VIPDKAIDAALLAMRGLNFWDYTDTDYIRAMLEAAAPYMLHDAWEAGCNEGLSWNPGYDDEARAANPYRTTK